MTEFSGAEVQIQEDDGGVEEDPEEHLLSSVSQILICKIIYRSCVFIYITWEERGFLKVEVGIYWKFGNFLTRVQYL